jgi:hypothetical protein
MWGGGGHERAGIIVVVPEAHRISYVGDPSFVSAFVRLLNEEGVAIQEEAMSIAEQLRLDPRQEEPLSIVASGGYGVAADAISHAISEFAGRFPGRAQIHDDGWVPESHQLSYVGNPAFVETFIDMLTVEDLGVYEPEVDDDWPGVSEQLAQSNSASATISIRTSGAGDINVAIRAAIGKFYDRFPGQAEIRDEDEEP